MEIVSTRRRLVGTIIDILFCIIIATLLVAFDLIINPFNFMGNFSFVINFASLISFVYLLICYLVFNGGSLGRLVTASHIVTKDFKRMNIKTCFVRALLQSIFILHIINVLYQFANKTQESIFGYITDTTVVKIVLKKHN